MPKSTLPLTASGQVVTGVGSIRKVIVNTHSSGVIKFVDSPGGASGRVVLSDYTLPSGAQVLNLDLEFYEGLYFILVSGTATIQVLTDPN